MGTISKITEVPIANTLKVNGVAKSVWANLLGQIVPSGSTWTDDYGIQLDGQNDYANITLSSDPVNKEKGTIAFWFEYDQEPASTQTLLVLHDYSNGGSTANRIIIQVYKITTNQWCVRFFYKSTVGGTAVVNNCVAKSSTPEFGKPWARKPVNMASGNYNPNSTMTNRKHLAISWDTTSSFTNNSTSYNGAMKMYLDGVLMNVGQSTTPAHNGTGTANSMQKITGSFLNMYLGIRHHGTSNSYNSFTDGFMNDVSIYDTDLSDASIAAIYNSGVPIDLLTNSGSYINSSNLVGYWDFEGNSGTTITDSSTNSNNGVLVNGGAFIGS